MAIVQISKIQQRAGNLVDLPQLDNAEFGWAADENRLFIGRTGNTYADENIEVLTSYSNISFSQINGSDGGNFNVVGPENGQILTYVSSTDTWENYTGLNAQLDGAKLKLGDVSNISMTGGAIGYILETDGLGNLSWTPKNTLYTPVINLTNNVTGNIITMKVANTTPYTNGQIVTITSATISNAGANSNINGNTFYLKLNGDYATSGNVVLYTDSGLTVTANGAGLVTYTANSGIATAVLGGSGSGVVGGSNTTVQFNDQNISNGVAAFTFNKNTTTLTVSSGNVVAANINATTAVTSPILVSNIANGTAPLTVTSTTLVPNLFVARSNVSEYSNTALTTTGTWYPLFVNATSGNLAQSANANLSFNAATGNLTTTLLNVTSNANTGNLGTTTVIATTGNITTINSGLMKNSTSNITIASAGNVSAFIGGNPTAQFVVTSTGANIPGTANVVTLVTSTATITTGNITTINSGLMQNGNSNITITANANISHFVTGNATSQLTVTATGANIPGTANVVGNANVGNLGTAQVFASANITTPQFISNVASGTAPLVVTSPTRVANLNVDQANIANYANVVTQITGTFYPTMVSGSTSANYQLGSNANLSFTVATGALSATLLTGTLTTAAQPNITSVGILTSLNSSGNINIAAGYILQWNSGDVGISRSSAGILSLGNGTNNDSTGQLNLARISATGNAFLSTSGGNTGIGTSSPAAKLAVVGGTTNASNLATAYSTASFNITPKSTSGYSLAFGSGPDDRPYIQMSASGTAPNDIMIQPYGGYVGIGTISTNVYDQVAAQRPLVVQRSDTSTTLNGSTAAITIVNGDTTTNNTAQLNFAAITGASTSQYSSAIISAIFGARTNAQYPTGQLVFSTSTTLNTAPSEKMRIDSAGNVGIGNTAPTNTLSVTGTAYVSGNANVGNIGGTGAVFTTLGGSLTTAAQGNITSVGTLTSLNVVGTTTGAAFTANTGVFTGNGSALTALNASNVSTGTLTQARLANASVTLGNTALTLGSTVTTVAGLTSVTSTTFVGALTGAATTAGTVTTAAQGNITSVGTLTGLTLSNAAVISVGSNTNVGTFTGNFSLSAGSRLNATYADLAERYVSDQQYEPGTVVVFGGEFEVTISNAFDSHSAAGVVSTNPAYLMNLACEGEHVIDLALSGRVPVLVQGNVSKGDLMVTGPNGRAVSNNMARAGTIIGKSLENFTGDFGLIEVVIGKS
jgi:hypothetical protein